MTWLLPKTWKALQSKHLSFSFMPPFLMESVPTRKNLLPDETILSIKGKLAILSWKVSRKSRMFLPLKKYNGRNKRAYPQSLHSICEYSIFCTIIWEREVTVGYLIMSGTSTTILLSSYLSFFFFHFSLSFFSLFIDFILYVQRSKFTILTVIPVKLKEAENNFKQSICVYVQQTRKYTWFHWLN